MDGKSANYAYQAMEAQAGPFRPARSQKGSGDEDEIGKNQATVGLAPPPPPPEPATRKDREDTRESEELLETDQALGNEDDVQFKGQKGTLDKNWRFPRQIAPRERAVESAVSANSTPPPSIPLPTRSSPLVFDPFPGGFEDNEWQKWQKTGQKRGQNHHKKEDGTGVISSDEKIQRDGGSDERKFHETITLIEEEDDVFAPTERFGIRERDLEDRVATRHKPAPAMDEQWNIRIGKRDHYHLEQKEIEEGIIPGGDQPPANISRNRIPFEGVGIADEDGKNSRTRTRTERALQREAHPSNNEFPIDDIRFGIGYHGDQEHATRSVIQMSNRVAVGAKEYPMGTTRINSDDGEKGIDVAQLATVRKPADFDPGDRSNKALSMKVVDEEQSRPIGAPNARGLSLNECLKTSNRASAAEYGTDNSMPHADKSYPAQARYTSEFREHSEHEAKENVLTTASGWTIVKEEDDHDEDEAFTEYMALLRRKISSTLIKPSVCFTSDRNSFDIIIHMERRTLEYAQMSGSSFTARVCHESLLPFDLKISGAREHTAPETRKSGKSKAYASPETSADQEDDRDGSVFEPGTKSQDDFHPRAERSCVEFDEYGGRGPTFGSLARSRNERVSVEQDARVTVRTNAESSTDVAEFNKPNKTASSAKEGFVESGRQQQISASKGESGMRGCRGEESQLGPKGGQHGASRARNDEHGRDRTAGKAGRIDETADAGRGGRVVNGRLAAEKIKGKAKAPLVDETNVGRGPLNKNGRVDEDLTKSPSLESVLAALAPHDRLEADPTRADRKLCAPFEEDIDQEERRPTPPCIVEERARERDQLSLNRATNSADPSTLEHNQQDGISPSKATSKSKIEAMIKSKLRKAKTHANLAGLYKSSSMTNVNNAVIGSMSVERNPPILSKSRSTVFDYMRGKTKEGRETEKIEKEDKELKVRREEIQKQVDAIQEEDHKHFDFTPLSIILSYAQLEIDELRAREDEKRRKISTAMFELGALPGDMRVDFVDVDAMDAELTAFQKFYSLYCKYGGEHMEPMPELRLITLGTKNGEFNHRTVRPKGVPIISVDPMA